VDAAGTVVVKPPHPAVRLDEAWYSLVPDQPGAFAIVQCGQIAHTLVTSNHTQAARIAAANKPTNQPE
jgi:hypothetical protein